MPGASQSGIGSGLEVKVHNSQNRNWRHLVLGLALVVIGGWLVYQAGRGNDAPRVVVSGDLILVDVADSPDERGQGLSGRESLAPNQGMLFIFDEPLSPQFSMREMNFPIDIVWISEDLNIVAVTPTIAVETYPDTFAPPGPVKYVLEVNSGLSASRGWLAGDKVELKLND